MELICGYCDGPFDGYYPPCKPDCPSRSGVIHEDTDSSNKGTLEKEQEIRDTIQVKTEIEKSESTSRSAMSDAYFRYTQLKPLIYEKKISYMSCGNEGYLQIYVPNQECMDELKNSPFVRSIDTLLIVKSQKEKETETETEK